MPSLNGGYVVRKTSAATRLSRRMTSAPKFARYLPTSGPAAAKPISTTRIPLSAPGWVRAAGRVAISVIRRPPPEDARAPRDGLPLHRRSRRCARRRAARVAAGEGQRRQPLGGRQHLPEIASAELRVGERIRRVAHRVAEHLALHHSVEEFGLRERTEERRDGGLDLVDLG